MIDLDFIKRLNEAEEEALTTLASEIYWEFSNENTVIVYSDVLKPFEITEKQTEKMLDDMLQFIHELKESQFVTDEKIIESLDTAYATIHSLIKPENVVFIKNYTNEALEIDRDDY